MVPAADDVNLSVLYGVDQPVLIIDSSGPVACQTVFKWLRLTNTFIPMSIDVFDEHIDSFEHPATLTCHHR